MRLETQKVKRKQMPYEVLEQAFPVPGRGCLQDVKRIVLTLPALLLYQNDNELMTLVLHYGKIYSSRTLSSRQT